MNISSEVIDKLRESCVAKHDTIADAMDDFAYIMMTFVGSTLFEDVHRKISELEMSDSHVNGGIPMSDLFESLILDPLDEQTAIAMADINNRYPNHLPDEEVG
tara:strand:+ start:1237 stop:1545 length:309 start_codon:yes stop_codon:yes gene_type:complete